MKKSVQYGNAVPRVELLLAVHCVRGFKLHQVGFEYTHTLLLASYVNRTLDGAVEFVTPDSLAIIHLSREGVATFFVVLFHRLLSQVVTAFLFRGSRTSDKQCLVVPARSLRSPWTVALLLRLDRRGFF